MIKSITVTNHLNESLTMELTRPELSGFVIKSIEGLGPAEANVNFTELATLDGSLFNSARLNSREITFSLKFLEKTTIEETRHLSYKYFPIKKNVRVTIETDTRTSYVEGIVEKNEPNIFNKDEGSTITVKCADPYFYSMNDKPLLFYGVDPSFEFPVSNEVDVELLEEPLQDPISSYRLSHIDYTIRGVNGEDTDNFNYEGYEAIDVQVRNIKKDIVYIYKNFYASTSGSINDVNEYGYFVLSGSLILFDNDDVYIKIWSQSLMGKTTVGVRITGKTEKATDYVVEYAKGDPNSKIENVEKISGISHPDYFGLTSVDKLYEFSYLKENTQEAKAYNSYYTPSAAFQIRKKGDYWTIYALGVYITDTGPYQNYYGGNNTVGSSIPAPLPYTFFENDDIKVAMKYGDEREVIVGDEVVYYIDHLPLEIITYAKTVEGENYYLESNSETYLGFIPPEFRNGTTAQRMYYIEGGIEFGDIHDITEGDIYYDGDDDNGIRIEIHASGKCAGLTIYNYNTRQYLSLSDEKIEAIMGSGISSGDIMVINTTRGNKSVTLTRGGMTYNILNALNKPIEWFKLSKGYNTFGYTATSGLIYLTFKIDFNTLYLGA